MDSFPAQSAPTPGRNAAAGEFASAGAILALAGLCVVLLAFSSLPRHGQAGDSKPAMPRIIPSWLLAPQLETHLYIVVTDEGEASSLRSLLAAETQLRARLGERQRRSEVIRAADEREAAALVESINDQASLQGVGPMRAILGRSVQIEGPVGSAID